MAKHEPRPSRPTEARIDINTGHEFCVYLDQVNDPVIYETSVRAADLTLEQRARYLQRKCDDIRGRHYARRVMGSVEAKRIAEAV